MRRTILRGALAMVPAVAMAAGVLWPQPAGAVFTFTPLGNPREVTLRVGSANATTNNVTFTVTNANVSPTPTPVTGVPGGGAPVTSPTGGIEIRVATRMPLSLFGTDTMTLTVDSTAGLACVGGTGCGATVIPMTTISWTSYNTDPSGDDIPSGAFTGSATQQLASYSVYTGFPWNGQSVTMTNVLVFQYSNATLYPSGRYSGRVVYTATNL